MRYARTGDAADRAFVEKCLRYVIGTETRNSTDGTSTGDGLLSTMRNLPAFILSADFIGLDKSLTGSRSGWTSTSWGTWIGSLRTKTIGSHGRWNQIVATSIDSASNWGAAAMASRTMIALYLDDVDTALVNHWRRWMGDASYGVDFKSTSSFDSSWACTAGETWPSGSVRRPINTNACGPDKAGIVVEDLSRSSGSYPNYDETGRSYANEHLGFILTAAIAMKRAGYPVETWGASPSAPSTLRLAGDWVQRKGFWPQLGPSAIHSGLPWTFNHLLGTSYATNAPVMGRMVSYADWWGR